MITQLNSVFTSESVAMKCLTYIDFFCCHNLEQTELSLSVTTFILVKSRKQDLWSNWAAKVSFVRDICHKSGQCHISKGKSPGKSVVEMNNKSLLTVLGRASLYYGTVRKWRPSRKEQDLSKGDHAKCNKSGKHLQSSTNARISNIKVRIPKWIYVRLGNKYINTLEDCEKVSRHQNLDSPCTTTLNSSHPTSKEMVFLLQFGELNCITIIAYSLEYC